MTEAEGD